MLALEDTALDPDQVENLIKFCPTKEEIELLKVGLQTDTQEPFVLFNFVIGSMFYVQGYKGDKEKLGKCEQVRRISSLHYVVDLAHNPSHPPLYNMYIHSTYITVDMGYYCNHMY